MPDDEHRQRSEDLLLRVATDVVGGTDGDVVAERPVAGFLARARVTGRHDPSLAVVVDLGDEWLEAVFVRERPIGIAIIDDLHVDDDGYAAARLHELLLVVRAYLRGEATMGSRLTLRGRRPVMRIQSGGREWVAS